jgi:hypothetical protein
MGASITLHLSLRRETLKAEPDVDHADVAEHEVRILKSFAIWVVVAVEFEGIDLCDEVHGPKALRASLLFVITRLDRVWAPAKLCPPPEVVRFLWLRSSAFGGNDTDAILTEDVGEIFH